MSGPTKTEATRARFIREAMRLFGERGYDQTSMAEIAAAAGGSRANLYLYFHNKAEIVQARMHDVEADILALFTALDELPDHSPATLRSWLEDASALWLRHADEFSAITTIMDSETDILDEWIGLVRRLVEGQSSLRRLHRDPDVLFGRQVAMATLLHALERNFYFMYIRGHRERERYVLDALADQWAALYT